MTLGLAKQMRCFYSLGMIYPVYRTVTSLSAPILRMWAGRRLKRGKENPERVSERFGVASHARPDGYVVWVHAASVGESLSVLPLLDVLQKRMPQARFLITTGTITSADLMARRLPETMIHQFVPWDHPRWVARFMAHWQPDAVLWLESELWPNMLAQIKERDIPAILVNARISPKSYRAWSRVRGFARKLLSTFSLVLAGSQNTARAANDLGARNVRMIGNLKMGAKALPVDDAQLTLLRNAIGQRPCIGFMQTHPGEEIEAARLIAQWQNTIPDVLGIIVPRHHTRTDAIAKDLADYNIAIRSRDETITEQTHIYIADTIGEMGLWYSLCPIAVIGGSFIPHGGQNPIEGTHFGTAIVYGPHMFNFPDIVTELEQAGVAHRVANWSELDHYVRRIVAQPQELAALCEKSRRMAQDNQDVIERFAESILTCIGEKR